MPHPILDKIDDLDEAIGNSASVPPSVAAKARTYLTAMRCDIREALASPGDEERARQAQEQGESDRGGYWPVRNASGSRP